MGVLLHGEVSIKNKQTSTFFLFQSFYEIDVEEDIRLPTQSTGAMTRLIFSICEEIQRANSHMLDQIIMKRLRQILHKKMNEVFQSFLCSKDSDITEYGSLQMIFDYLFLKSIFQQYEEKSSLLNDDNVLGELQKKVIRNNNNIFRFDLIF